MAHRHQRRLQKLVSGVEMFDLGMPCRRPARPRGHGSRLDRLQPSETNSQRRVAAGKRRHQGSDRTRGRQQCKRRWRVDTDFAVRNTRIGQQSSIAGWLRPNRDRARTRYGNDQSRPYLSHDLVFGVGQHTRCWNLYCICITDLKNHARSLLYSRADNDMPNFFRDLQRQSRLV